MQQLSRGPIILAFFALPLGIGCNCGGGDVYQLDGVLVVRPDPVDLGRVAVTLATRATLSLENTGNAVVTIKSAQPSESLQGEVRLDGVPAALPPNGKAEASVIFAPTSRGPREGELIFNTDSRAHPEVRVRVVALAIDPRLVAMPALIDFGRVVVGRTATAATVVENTGDVPIVVSAVGPDIGTSPELEASISGIQTLAPGERFTVSLAYRPVDVGLDEGRMIVNDDTALPDKLGFMVRGEGVAAELEIDPLSLVFQGQFVGETRTRSFDIRNIGARPHTVSVMHLVRTATGGEISIVTSTATQVPFELAPGQLVRVDVSYTPTDTSSDFDQVRIESTGLNIPAYVDITASAQSAPIADIDVTPPRLAFGSVQVGSMSPRAVRIANFGGADLHLMGQVDIQPAGTPYTVSGGPVMDAVLAPLDSHTLTVEFRPTVVGPAPGAELVINSDDPDEATVRIPISGEGQTGAVPDIEVTPDPVVFGQVPRGTLAARSVTVRNVGSAPLTVSQVSLPLSAASRFTIQVLPVVPLVLAPGMQAQLQVGYQDSNGLQALHVGTLRFMSDDPDEAMLDVTLTAETVPPPVGMLDLAITLSWDTNDTDVDLHLVRPGGAYFDRPSDACYCNPNPDWGVANQGTDNPFLDRDDIDGLGPENINLQDAVAGDYRIFVHYFSDHGHGGPSNAQVSISSQGVSLGMVSRALSNNDQWEVGTVTWNGSSGVFTAAGTPLNASVFSSCF